MDFRFLYFIIATITLFLLLINDKGKNTFYDWFLKKFPDFFSFK